MNDHEAPPASERGPDRSPGGSTSELRPATGRDAFDDRAYWSANLRTLSVLLSVWFAVSFGAGILFKDFLDQWTLPGTGFPLGFWFAQQGSIYVFVVLIFVYVAVMNRIDRRFGAHED